MIWIILWGLVIEPDEVKASENVTLVFEIKECG